MLYKSIDEFLETNIKNGKENTKGFREEEQEATA